MVAVVALRARLMTQALSEVLVTQPISELLVEGFPARSLPPR
jgi:hypothetical protein